MSISLPKKGTLSTETKEVILKVGVNLRDYLGNTVLHYACEGENNELVLELVVRMSADVNIQNNIGETPLHKASASGHPESVCVLVNNDATPGIKDNYGKTSLHHLFEGHNTRLKRCRSQRLYDPTNVGEPSINTLAIARRLMNNGEDPWAKDHNGNSALPITQDYNCISSQYELERKLIQELEKKYMSMQRVENLVMYSDQMDTVVEETRGHFGYIIIPLSLLRISYQDLEETIRISLNSIDDLRNTNRDYLIRSLLIMNKRAQLLKEGLSKTLLCTKDSSSSENEARYAEIWDVSIKLGLSRLVTVVQYGMDTDDTTPLDIMTSINIISEAALCDDLSDFRTIDDLAKNTNLPDGNTVLHNACLISKAHVKLLSNWKGLDINAVNEKGMTPLHIACLGVCDDVVSILIKRGADMSKTDGRGLTPLHYTVLYSLEIDSNSKLRIEILTKARIKIAETLIDNGADINARSNDGITILEYAKKVGNTEFIKMLASRGQSNWSLRTNSGTFAAALG